IKTDSAAVEAPKPTEASPLYSLLQLMAPESEFKKIDESWRSGGSGYGIYKKQLLEFFHLTFDGPRKRREELLSDRGELERILLDGAQRARVYAQATMKAVRRAVGID